MVTVSCRVVLVVTRLVLLSSTVMGFEPVTRNQLSEEDKEEEQVTLTEALSNTINSLALVSKVTPGKLSPSVCGYMQALCQIIVSINDPFEERHYMRC